MLKGVLIVLVYFLPSTMSDSIFEVVYWEVKPFIFRTAKGTLDGIIPRIFSKGQRYCANRTLVKYQRQLVRKEFYDLLRSDLPYGTGELVNVSKSKAVWVPIVSFDDKDADYEVKRHLRSFELFKSTEIAIIVPRNLVSLPNKILRGILSCGQIILIAILLSMLFGILIWIAERLYNKEFPKSFIKGAGTGVWWSLVSMTTVGYGDVVPRSLIGRLVAMIWVFIGVMIACVMTATTTEIVTGVEDLNVYGKTVSVLEKSVEERRAKDYRAIVRPTKSYHDAIELVREGEVFAAMVNADVAAWYQEEIHDDTQKVPLRIIQTVPASLPINCLMTLNATKEIKAAVRCMHTARDEVYDEPVDRFRQYCHTETLYHDSVSDLFSHTFIQILTGIISCLVVIGLTFELYTKKYTEQKRGQHRCLDSDVNSFVEQEKEMRFDL